MDTLFTMILISHHQRIHSNMFSQKALIDWGKIRPDGRFIAFFSFFMDYCVYVKNHELYVVVTS